MWSKACGKRFKKTKRKTRKMNCRAGQDTNHKLLENKHYYYTSSVYILWQPTARAGSHNLSDLFALSRVSSHLTDMSHHITLYRGRICSPSVYPRRCRCVFCAKSDGEDWKPQGWQTLAYAQFRLHCQQFFHFWLFPHANFSTSYCFSTILSVFSALRVSPAPRRHDKWCQRSCIVFRKGKQELEKGGGGDFEYVGEGSWQCWKMYATKSTQTFAAAPSWPHSGVTCLAKSFSNAKNPSGKVRT